MKIMPIFLPVISFGLPAGLVLYFAVSNLYRIGQQSFISRSIYGIKRGDEAGHRRRMATARRSSRRVPRAVGPTGGDSKKAIEGKTTEPPRPPRTKGNGRPGRARAKRLAATGAVHQAGAKAERGEGVAQDPDQAAGQEHPIRREHIGRRSGDLGEGRRRARPPATAPDPAAAGRKNKKR